MRVVIDTNVIIDAFTGRDEFCEKADQILLAIERGYIKGMITANSLLDVAYHVQHVVHDKKKAQEYVRAAMGIFEVIDVCEGDCRMALESGRGDFEDAVLIESARRHGADYIVTRNVRDFKDAIVPAITPKKLMGMIYDGGNSFCPL